MVRYALYIFKQVCFARIYGLITLCTIKGAEGKYYNLIIDKKEPGANLALKDP